MPRTDIIAELNRSQKPDLRKISVTGSIGYKGMSCVMYLVENMPNKKINASNQESLYGRAQKTNKISIKNVIKNYGGNLKIVKYK